MNKKLKTKLKDAVTILLLHNLMQEDQWKAIIETIDKRSHKNV